MTAQTLEPVTVGEGELRGKHAGPVERARFPLVLKLFGLTALLIVIVVGLAVGITIERANRVANETINASISGAAGMFDEFEKQRTMRLALPALILGNDPSFVAYMRNQLLGEEDLAEPVSGEVETAPDAAPASPAEPIINLPSILDQLEQRRRSFESDMLALLDDQGRLVARTDQTATADPPLTDLYESTLLVKRLVDDPSLTSTTGVLSLDGKLYHAAVAPVGVGTPRITIGYLLNAFEIDDRFANRIAESTNAGVVIVAREGKSLSARSANAPSVGMQQMAGTDAILRTGKPVPPSQEKIDRSEYVMTGRPLFSGSDVVGAALFLRSRDRELAPFREIERAMLIGGGIALLLAFLFSWLIARRLTRPIEQLAGMAQEVTAGNYAVNPDMQRDDEVGILGRSFGKMISALRDKAELEVLYREMADRSSELAAHEVERAQVDEGTVLVTDLRGLPATFGEGDADAIIGTVQRALKLQEAEIARQDGEVREVAGHRLVALFRGERGIIHAIRAARAINEELASIGGMSAGIGIASGEFVTGSLTLDTDSGFAILGNAPLLALLFAWHAPGGVAYVSYETAEAAGSEVLATSTREEVRLKWLPQPLPVAALPLAGVSTGIMRAIGGSTASMATMKLESRAIAPNRELPPGHLFAQRYRIEQVLGRGGMGIVYKATDTQLDETVAIKTLPGDAMSRSPEDLERFKREIRLARRITHRNVLRTFDYGEAEGVYFISMEYVRGYTLAELVEQGPLRQMAPRAVAGIGRQICRGLQAAHEQGIIHRDIKPQNVLIDARGEVKLMDFGIARMTEAAEATAMTQAGLIVGTPHYMSPEQVQGRPLDPRSDVYSMGVLLYELLAGKRPFESSSLTGVLTAHVTEKPRPLLEVRAEAGPRLSAIVMRSLEKNPSARFANAGALLAELDALHSKSAEA